jgi:hypothetical protein
MLRRDIPADPDVHRAACDIAKRFTAMMLGILRDEERHDAEREAYILAREVIEELVIIKGKP